MEEQKLKQALTEATVNAAVLFALSLGVGTMGKLFEVLAGDISWFFVAMQSAAVGLIRFATYMLEHEESVKVGALTELFPTRSASPSLVERTRNYIIQHRLGTIV